MTAKQYCSCHGLGAQDFEQARDSGGQNVKACFRHFQCKPKCAECIPLVKAIIKGQGPSYHETSSTPAARKSLKTEDCREAMKTGRLSSVQT